MLKDSHNIVIFLEHLADGCAESQIIVNTTEICRAFFEKRKNKDNSLLVRFSVNEENLFIPSNVANQDMLVHRDKTSRGKWRQK